MIRTQIQLDDPVFTKLRHIAVQQRRSMASCIREAIELFLVRTEVATDDFSDIAGKFRPTPMDGIKEHDQYWAQSVVRERSQ